MNKLVNGLLAKLKDKHLNELVKGSIGFLILKIIGIGLSYIFLYLVMRWYDAAIWGIFSIAVAVARISWIVGRMGLDSALVRFTAEYAVRGKQDLVRRLYWRGLAISVPLSLVITVLLYFGAPFLALHVFKNPGYTYALRLMALITLPGTLIFVNAAALRGLKRISSHSFLINAAQFLFGIILLFLGRGYFERSTAPVNAFAIATVISVVVSFFFGRIGEKAGKLQPGAEDAIRTWPLLKVAFPMLLTGCYSFLLNQTGVLALGILGTQTDVGIFNAVYKVGTLLTFTLTAINSIGAAKFSECHSLGDKKGFEQITHYSTRLIFWTTFPLAVIFIALPQPILNLFGKEVKTGTLALVILTVGFFVNAVSGPVGTILNMTGYQVVYQNIVLVAALINIGLNILLIPRYGINGAAIANTVSMIVWNIICVIYIKKKFNILVLYLPFLDRLIWGKK